MAHLIDKAALVAEIKKRINYYQAKNQKWGVAWYAGRVAEGEEILSYINTLEIKGVDLEKEYKDYIEEKNVWNNAHDFRPKHLQRCLCYDKYMGGVYCYVYDDISKYWCTQATVLHDPDGDNHICDYADYRITMWKPVPDIPMKGE